MINLFTIPITVSESIMPCPKTLTSHGSIIINKKKVHVYCLYALIWRPFYNESDIPCEEYRNCTGLLQIYLKWNIPAGLPQVYSKRNNMLEWAPTLWLVSLQNTSHMKRDGIFMFYEEIYFMSMQHDWKAWSGKMFDLESFQLHRMKEIDGRFVFFVVFFL